MVVNEVITGPTTSISQDIKSTNRSTQSSGWSLFFFVPIKKVVFLDFGGIRKPIIPIFFSDNPSSYRVFSFLIKKWYFEILEEFVH